MNENEITPENAPDAGAGFRISDQPVVQARAPEIEPAAEPVSNLGNLPASYGTDLLYAIARDPKSLFLYWDLDWKRLFAEAALEPGEVHLRILHEDGTEESTSEIDPFTGYCFANVAESGARYSCELGCFAGAEWKALIRSAPTVTPESAMSEDLEADFATLPLHLSFQRLLEILRGPEPQRKTLANSVAAIQKKTRALRESMAPGDWSKLVEAAAAFVDGETPSGLKDMRLADFATLLKGEAPGESQRDPAPELRERWRQLGERFGGSSWGGSSGSAGL